MVLWFFELKSIEKHVPSRQKNNWRSPPLALLQPRARRRVEEKETVEGSRTSQFSTMGFLGKRNTDSKKLLQERETSQNALPFQRVVVQKEMPVIIGIQLSGLGRNEMRVVAVDWIFLSRTKFCGF